MVTGYDYLLLREGHRRRIVRFLALSMVIVGVVMVSLSGGYYLYSLKARSGIMSLEVRAADDLSPSGVSALPANGILGEMSTAKQSSLVSSIGTGDQATGTADVAGSYEGNATSVAAAVEPSVSLTLPASAIAARSIFPGEALRAKFWNNPQSYEPTKLAENALIKGFKPVSTNQGATRGSLTTATRIVIPALDIDSKVNELQILNLGDSRAYETPKFAVGHIPESSNPGETGGGWFFGHLESPLRNEGSVFFKLPQIANMLRQGETVYVIVESEDGSYLYKVTGTRVVHESQMQLWPSDKSVINLVTCVPRLVYDYRLIVTAELVGVKSGPAL